MSKSWYDEEKRNAPLKWSRNIMPNLWLKYQRTDRFDLKHTTCNDSFESLTSEMKHHAEFKDRVKWKSLQDYDPENHIDIIKDYIHNVKFPKLPAEKLDPKGHTAFTSAQKKATWSKCTRVNWPENKFTKDGRDDLNKVFRVDQYGNVISPFARPGAPTAIAYDHAFPFSRGGRTRDEPNSTESNIIMIQHAANGVKSDTIEQFLQPRRLNTLTPEMVIAMLKSQSGNFGTPALLWLLHWDPVTDPDALPKRADIFPNWSSSTAGGTDDVSYEKQILAALERLRKSEIKRSEAYIARKKKQASRKANSNTKISPYLFEKKTTPTTTTTTTTTTRTHEECEYSAFLRFVLMDDMLEPLELDQLEHLREKLGISEEQHIACVRNLDVSEEMWNSMVEKGAKNDTNNNNNNDTKDTANTQNQQAQKKKPKAQKFNNNNNKSVLGGAAYAMRIMGHPNPQKYAKSPTSTTTTSSSSSTTTTSPSKKSSTTTPTKATTPSSSSSTSPQPTTTTHTKMLDVCNNNAVRLVLAMEEMDEQQQEDLKSALKHTQVTHSVVEHVVMNAHSAKQDLSKHTKAELKAMAKERNLKVSSSLKIDELRALIVAYETEQFRKEESNTVQADEWLDRVRKMSIAQLKSEAETLGISLKGKSRFRRCQLVEHIANVVAECAKVRKMLKNELVEMCQQHEISHVGKKVELIDRICLFLRTDVVEEDAKVVAKSSPKAMSTSSPKAKDKASKENTPTKSTKSSNSTTPTLPPTTPTKGAIVQDSESQTPPTPSKVAKKVLLSRCKKHEVLKKGSVDDLAQSLYEKLKVSPKQELVDEVKALDVGVPLSALKSCELARILSYGYVDGNADDSMALALPVAQRSKSELMAYVKKYDIDTKSSVTKEELMHMVQRHAQLMELGTQALQEKCKARKLETKGSKNELSKLLLQHEESSEQKK